MSSISSYMTQGHRACDEQFIQAEQAVANQNWDAALTLMSQFIDALEQHLQQEELVLFPRFEQATGMTQGPTQVMRAEHIQMRALGQNLLAAIQQKAQAEALGGCETLMVLMQQHNMKEEQILYPMSDRMLANAAEVLSEIQAQA